MRDIVGRFLERRALLDPARTALLCGSERLTFEELNDLVARTAARLAAEGVKPGDRVAVLMKNGIAFCALYHAVARLGAVLCPVNWRLAPAEVAYILGDCGARLLFHDSEFADTVSALPDLSALEARVPVGSGSKNALTADHGPEGIGDPAPDDPLLIVYTSGTTGRPKGAVLTQSQMAWSSATMAFTCDYRRGDTNLIPVPLFHVGGLSFATLFVHLGTTAILIREWEPGGVLDLIEREKVNHFFAVATMVRSLLSHPSYERADLSSLRWIMAGGAPVPSDLIEALAARDIPLIQTYGATETAGPAVVVGTASALAKAGAAGQPFFHTDIRIVDEDGENVPPGTPGEIQIRGPHLFDGYWQNQAATRAARAGDWYCSGDIGYLDEDGYLYVIDRKKDMIVSGGENIYPAEIEDALGNHEAVAEIAVIGVPDETWGEIACAVVVPGDGPAPTLEELRDFGAARLARYKLPRRLELRAEPLPRNATGKILKHELRTSLRE